MTAKHTPGPWRIFTTMDGTKLIGIGDSNGEGIIDAGFGVWREGDPEAIANARLIAAAPDLVDALEELLDACNELNDAYNSRMIDPHAMSSARAALAKAKGEKT
jgi:hypothetical protein